MRDETSRPPRTPPMYGLSAHQFETEDQAEDGPLGQAGQPNGSASGAGILGTTGQVGTAGW